MTTETKQVELDVEAFLDEVAEGLTPSETNGTRTHGNNHGRSDDRGRDPAPPQRRSGRDVRRDRSRDRKDSDVDMKEGQSGDNDDSHRLNRHRSRSPRHRRSDRGGDYYRRSRSRSPDRYRPGPGGRTGRPNDRDRDRYRDRDNRGYRGGRGRADEPRRDRSRNGRATESHLSEEDKDRRTVFVMQLANRLEIKHLFEFFSTKAGPVKDAQIVKDRVSGRSKGVGYVEFQDEESVPKALELTGKTLKGLPIIVALTEAEKNRQARNETQANPGVPFHRLYVGNIHFSITEADLTTVFEPFGPLEFVQLQKEEGGRSRGYGFVQFLNPNHAKDALEKMNGFMLADRAIRVGLGNDKFTAESTANLLRGFSGQAAAQPSFQGSSFSGAGGRGIHAGGAGGSFDRTGGRDNDRGAGGASALDDMDVSGPGLSNFSRNDLMRKLARLPDTKTEARPAAAPTRPPVSAMNMDSRCIVARHMWTDKDTEEDNWQQELEEDVKMECQEKYGDVLHVGIDLSTPGSVYIKFKDTTGGRNGIRGLNGRFFGGNMITAEPVSDVMYNTRFPNSGF